MARLLTERNRIDQQIAAIIGRPMTAGHLGEWIASEIFGIRLEDSAVTAGFDGRFGPGPLEGQTVNVKWYLKREGGLDLADSPAVDHYLVPWPCRSPVVYGGCAVCVWGNVPSVDTPGFRPVDPAKLGIADPHVDIDVTVPSPARMYDYYLGGKDNFPADRNAAEKALEAWPAGRDHVRANRAFLVRAVRQLAAAGIDQFIDLGTGIPTSPNVHEVAREVDPAARVVYVDNDPIVTVHNRALRATHDVICIERDIRNPASIIDDEELRALIDFTRPVGLLAIAVFHFIVDDEDPAGLLATWRQTLADGSYLVLSHVSGQAADKAAAAYQKATSRARPRSHAEIADLLTGWTVLDPGLVPVQDWRPDDDADDELAPGGATIYGAVAHLP